MDVEENFNKCALIFSAVLVLSEVLVFLLVPPYTFVLPEGFNEKAKIIQIYPSGRNSAEKSLGWGYICNGDFCYKAYGENLIQSYSTCSMTCGKKSMLWPVPQEIRLGTDYEKISIDNFQLITSPKESSNLLKNGFEIFKNNVKLLKKNSVNDGTELFFKITMKNSDVITPQLSTDESYELSVSREYENVIVKIEADNYFGIRHGLETLLQLIWYDEKDDALYILNDVAIKDYPRFKHRGVMVDTGRNFISLDGLKRVIDGMSANKLNVFHWHITDSQSFPFDVRSVPEMAFYGAYSALETYNSSAITELVEYARIRGVRVIIEVDGPSHVNFGWQWGQEKQLGNLTLNCGENTIDHILNPFNNHSLDILEHIYEEIGNLQTTTEAIHIGGDEVTKECWNKYKNTSTSYADFWVNYISLMIDRLEKANVDRKPQHIILWSSDLIIPSLLHKYLPKNKIVIQFWYGNIKTFVKEDFKIIFSPVGSWYLDCGFGKWREGKKPACKFNEWQNVYISQPWNIYNIKEELVLGGEVCLWSEQVVEDTLDVRLWPRTAAFAERIWSNPESAKGISTDVYLRLSEQRERLRKRGLHAEAIWPERCDQNPTLCP